MYILKGDMYQSIEIRCDQTVTKKLKSAERSNYLTVILKEYKASVQEKNFENLQEPCRCLKIIRII